MDSERLARLSPGQRALLEQRLQSRAVPAIVGMACRLPGGVNNLAQLWRVFTRGEVAVGRPSPARLRVGAPLPQAGYLDQIDRFDADLFSIGPMEAEQMEPRQRLLLETSWAAFEDAGIPLEKLKNSRTGVFIGSGSTLDYPTHPSPYELLGRSQSILAHRLSYFYDLHGPSLVVDTACASGLVALGLAMDSLRRGQCETAVVGACSLLLDESFLEGLKHLGIVSPSLHSRPWDQGADGLVPAEGCVVLILRQVDPTLEGCWALLRAVAHEQCGTGNGLVAPNGLAQQRVMRAALKQAGKQPQEVGYLEVHGSSSPTGDLLEAEAVRAVYGSRTTPLLCGTNKANFGNCFSAAGLVSILRTVLILHHGRIPPQAGGLNLHADIQEHLGETVSLPKSEQAWEGANRLAAVNAFAMGGSHVHVVLQAPPERASVPEPARLTLGFWASDADGLALYRESWIEWLEKNHQDAHLASRLAQVTQQRTRFACAYWAQAETGAGLLDYLRKHPQSSLPPAEIPGLAGACKKVADLPGLPMRGRAYWARSVTASGSNLRELVWASLGEVLPKAALQAGPTFTEMGFDSLKRAAFHRDLERRLGWPVPPALVLGAVDPEQLIASLAEEKPAVAVVAKAADPLTAINWRAVALVVPFLAMLAAPKLDNHFKFDKTPVLRRSVFGTETGQFGLNAFFVRNYARLVGGQLKSTVNAESRLGKYDFWFARDRYFERPLPYWSQQKWKLLLSSNHTGLASRGIRDLVVVCPSKEEIYTYFAPRGAGQPFVAKEDRLFDTLAKTVPGLNILHLKSALIEASKVDQDKPLFLRTGLHWNSKGAVAGAQAIAGRLREWFPDLAGVDQTVSWSRQMEFAADQARASALEDVLREDNCYARPVHPNYRWSSPNFMIDSLRWSAPIGSVSLDPQSTLPTALVFRDSMGELLSPHLSQCFSKVTYVHTGWPPHALGEMVEAEAPDVVIWEMGKIGEAEPPPAMEFPETPRKNASIRASGSEWRIEIPEVALQAGGRLELIVEVQGEPNSVLEVEGRKRSLSGTRESHHILLPFQKQVLAVRVTSGELNAYGVRYRLLPPSDSLERRFAASQQILNRCNWVTGLSVPATECKISCAQSTPALEYVSHAFDRTLGRIHLENLSLDAKGTILKMDMECPGGVAMTFWQSYHGRTVTQRSYLESGSNVCYWRVLPGALSPVLVLDSYALDQRPVLKSLEVRGASGLDEFGGIINDNPVSSWASFSPKLNF